ncbi:MAG: Penicillin acylase family protein [Actinomycetota bacterium]|nr:Penicillin acylase family protein [Actinomycetota bacterium]
MAQGAYGARVRTLKRVLIGLVAVVLVFAIVGTGLFYWSTRRSFPQTSGTIDLPGLTAPVEVIRNARGVPDVYADKQADLYTAMGYVTAQDRFFQMDFNRHLTSGRLAEMFGARAVDKDAFLRTLGWRDTAAQEYAALTAQTRANLDNYAAGINAYLRNKSPGEVSFEYAVLGLQQPGYRIEAWDPIDSVAWLKAMAFFLVHNYSDEAQRSLIAAKVGIDRTEQLFPPYPYDRVGTVLSNAENADLAASEGASATLTADTVRESPSAQAALAHTSAMREGLLELMGAVGGQGEGIGSNSWVVSGSLTESGKPLLANDMHLEPQMPSIWYQAGMHCRTLSPACPLDVSGFILPSVPGVIVGHNAHISWGFTNLGPDVSDLVLERVEGDSYIVDGVPRPIASRTETIKVAGGDPVQLTVRTTDAGPIVSDIPGADGADFRAVGNDAPVPAPGQTITAPSADSQGDYAVALKWTALSPQPTMEALPALNTATDFAQFQAAAKLFTVPAQHMIYADTQGAIGYQAPGQIPIRSGYDGRWPVPGWDSQFTWSGFIPFEQLPSIQNPPAGWIATANDFAVPAQSSQALVQTDIYSYGSRAKRIDIRIAELVDAGQKLTVADMQNIQLDAGNDFAAWLAPKLLTYNPGESAQQAIALLNGWDFQQPTTSAAAMYFNAVYSSLVERMFVHALGPESLSFNAGDRYWETIRSLWDSPDDLWWDDVGTPEREDRDTTITNALRAAADEVAKLQGSDPTAWTWGSAHTLTVKNPTLGSTGMGLIDGIFNRGPVQTAGGGGIPLANSWNPGGDPGDYHVTAVPSMRQVVDLAVLDSSTWVNLTGNSGHTYNANYNDQFDAWNSGQQFPFAFTRPSVEQAGMDTLTLEP